MENLHEIFEKNNFKLTKDRVKATEFENIKSKDVIYLDKETTSEITIYLNPNIVEGNLKLKSESKLQHRSSLTKFPKRMHGGQKPINCGYSFKFQTIDKLDSFLRSFDAYEILDDNTLIEILADAKDVEEYNNSITYTGAPQPKKEPKEDSIGRKKYPRNSQVAFNALKIARHVCEFDNSHITFKRKRDGNDYTEPHHLIPLSSYNDFQYSLDVEENIVSLCSNCHNLLHYGAEFEVVLKKLYEARKDMLESVGLKITYDELKKYYSSIY